MSSMIENFDSLARLLLEALLNTLWQGMLVTVLVWLLLRCARRASATTRHAVWLVTLLTIGALPFVAIVTSRNLPAGNPSSTTRPETMRPVIQTATPIVAPEVNDFADPFSFESGIARLKPQAGQDRPKTSYDFKLAPQPQEPRLAGQRLDLAVPTTTREETPGDVSSVAAVKADLAKPPVEGEETPGDVPSVAAVSSDVEKKSLLRRAQLWFTNALSGTAPLLLIILWLAVCGLMSWRIARGYRAVFHLRR